LLKESRQLIGLKITLYLLIGTHSNSFTLNLTI